MSTTTDRIMLADAVAVVKAAGYVLVRRETGMVRADPLMECVERAGRMKGERDFYRGEVERLRGVLAGLRKAADAKPPWADGGSFYDDLRAAVRAATRQAV